MLCYVPSLLYPLSQLCFCVSHISLPPSQLHGRLAGLVTRIRAQQAEVLQRALSKAELAERHFIADNVAGAEAIEEELERLASAHPSNMQAADALIHSVPRALLECVAERLGEFKT
jgi:hypothetical protein